MRTRVFELRKLEKVRIVNELILHLITKYGLATRIGDSSMIFWGMQLFYNYFVHCKEIVQLRWRYFF